MTDNRLEPCKNDMCACSQIVTETNCAWEPDDFVNLKTCENYLSTRPAESELREIIKECQGVFHSILAHRSCYDFSGILNKITTTLEGKE